MAEILPLYRILKHKTINQSYHFKYGNLKHMYSNDQEQELIQALIHDHKYPLLIFFSYKKFM